MYAVIQTGGKQYRVEPGQTVVVEKIEGEPGAAWLMVTLPTIWPASTHTKPDIISL